jgi:hypothetical protein
VVEPGAVGLRSTDPAHIVGQIGQDRAGDVCADGLADRVEQADRVLDEAAFDDRVAQAVEELLLAGGAGEVRLA